MYITPRRTPPPIGSARPQGRGVAPSPLVVPKPGRHPGQARSPTPELSSTIRPSSLFPIFSHVPRERAEKCRNSSGWHFHASQGCRASRREAIQASVFGRTLPGIERLPLGISSKIQQNTIIVRGLSVAGQNECCRRFYPAQPRDSVWATEHPETTQSTWTNNAYPPRCPTSAPDRSRSSVSGALLVIRSAAP